MGIEGPLIKDANGDVYKDRGFDDCTSSLVSVNFSDSNSTISSMDTVPAGEWKFYRFFVTDTDYQFNVNVLPQSNTTSIDLFLRNNEPPGSSYNEYDYRSYGSGELNIRFGQQDSNGKNGQSPPTPLFRKLFKKNKFR